MKINIRFNGYSDRPLEYRDFIINGATQHGLPGKYITKIEELALPSSLQILKNADAAWEASQND